MRRGLAAAALAALLGAALAAAGCKPSSLTPGFIGERGPEGGSASGILSGVWSGPTSNGGTIRFVVVDGNVQEIQLREDGPCRFSIFTDDLVYAQGRLFSTTFELENGGLFSIEGNFVAADLCSGTYAYTGLVVVGGCPPEAAGAFTAVPVL